MFFQVLSEAKLDCPTTKQKLDENSSNDSVTNRPNDIIN
jgi:hypothetical protein